MDTHHIDPHHPRHIRDMAGASDWERLATLVSRTSPPPPHILLSGPAGIGKSCAIRLALGTGPIVLWFRCSLDPSLRESRERIKGRACRTVAGAGDIQWIVLEHADLLHADAQAFLRRVMETAVGSTRFILEVRDVAAITEPLLSRTVLFNGPNLLEHEVRAEVLRRAPSSSVSLATASRIAREASGNVRWAVLQGLGNGDAMVADGVPCPESIRDWASLVAALEAVQNTGTSHRAWLSTKMIDWDRPGGADPVALSAIALVPCDT